MASDPIQITIDVDTRKLREALEKFPDEFRRNWAQAGREVSAELLGTEGLRNYPPAPSTAPPPYPGYVRGIGYINAKGVSNGKSERYRSQWNVRTIGSDRTEIGNRASYAKFLADEKEQSTVINKNIAGQGWRKLKDVADEKIGAITEIYNLWVKRALQRVGLL